MGEKGNNRTDKRYKKKWKSKKIGNTKKIDKRWKFSRGGGGGNNKSI